MKTSLQRVTARLSSPFVTHEGEIESRDLLVLRLEDSLGNVGWGEAAPLAVGIDQVAAALADCLATLSASDTEDPADLLSLCAELTTMPEALSAIDLALWDLAGNRAREPVWQLLGAADPPPVEVNATIAVPDRASAAREATAAAAGGFRTVKVKVGLGDDAGRVAAVRAAGGRELDIRLDANGAWAVPEALAALRALAPSRIELCEEPVHGVAAISELWRDSPVSLAMDESAAEPGALERRACDAVCLKLVRCGGISATIRAAALARSAGYEVYLASTLDGPLGIAAALHAAAAIGPDRACGLATLELFAGRADPLPARGGLMPVPDRPGLGVDMASWYG